MVKKLLYNSLLVFIFFNLASCIVNAPKYTTVEKVLNLKIGQSKGEVSLLLGTVPYNLILMTDSETTLLYKYRVTDRTTLPFLLKENNGKKIKGRYVNLLVTYDKDGLSKKIESCSNCDETIVQEKRVDINKVITFLTITLPIALVFLGITTLK
ncbi:MAG: hypothetical protein Q7W45_03990 [Bacteroidota bacterium]|nr:hypothetical protein [Bacteroidota bacterium]MDP3144607.1 hypothetical protein [Bacteroidota bacterium]MDP3556546.1 hypothetical protein [Bacteroidota bacterium]